ncbi:MAG: sugar ABC transporter substrate-binding protein [Firmicutes bacterium HGW-Firmicutes-9]|jgi:putative multiple sugar transport system substrate-binding protein|nr:MAG: sugar ABC transporter substrate-binding protein [Firmicutes bacterium HGW-Firmicutes-9]
MKRMLSLILACMLIVLSLAGCAGTAAPTDSSKTKVGLCMPTKEQPIWIAQGERLTEAFEAAGYEVVIEYAEDVVERQITQIENMLLKGCKYLVIAAVDGYAISDAVKKAKESGATVIASDRLIMNTTDVDYYMTFDLVRMGEIQGEYIEKALGLKDGKGPFTLEIFSGSPDDPNSIPFYEGAMNILKPYIDSGMLVVKSGQTTLDVTGTLKWDSATAQSRMDNILSSYYTDQKLDAVLVAADCLALGVISSLNSLGYGSDEKPFPVITGQDCELTAIKYILEGKQSMTVFLDAQLLSEKMVALVSDLEAGKEITPDTTYNNDAKEVPTLLYDPVLIDKDNYTLLIDRGFYTADDLN